MRLPRLDGEGFSNSACLVGVMTERKTFAGVSFKPTKRGSIRYQTVCKILRSGNVNVACTGRYTDDYAFDAAYNYGKGGLSAEAVTDLADKIEKDCKGIPNHGWRFYIDSRGNLSIHLHSFLGYDAMEKQEEQAA